MDSILTRTENNKIQEPGTLYQRTDTFQLPGVTAKLYQADCLDVMRLIPDGSVDLILTDLPYGTTKNTWDKPVDMEKLWVEYCRVLKDNGCVALWAQAPFDKMLALSNTKMFRYQWIVVKNHPTGFLNANRMPLKTHEMMLIFYKRLPTYHPQKTDGHPRKVSTAAQKATSKATTNYGHHGLTTYDSTERFPTDVLHFNWPHHMGNNCLHPTQKPVEACRYFIETYTNAGDTVLDSCMGSNTTGAAAMSCGRNYIGIEIDPDIYSIAVETQKAACREPRN